MVGKSVTIDELMDEEGFSAVFIGSGAGLPKFMGIPGEQANGVFSANEYLTRSNLMKAFDPDSRTPIMHGKKVAVVGGGLSLLASSNPDGLEWSMFGNAESGYSENMGLDEEDYGISSGAAEVAGSIQEKTAFLPDYAFANSDSPAGTTVSGLLGSAIVAGVAVLICMAGGFFRKKKAAAQA